MMKRDDCLRALARHITDRDIVLPVYSTAFDWIDIRPSALNYLSHGAMGLASSHALGLALGRPDRRVIVLDGDGSLLMNLGTLVSIATAAPPNLYHFVCQNGTYEANGGHPIPGRDRIDFAGFARSAGYRTVHEFADLQIFEQRIGALLGETGPVFADLKIVSGGPQERDYSRLHGPHVRQAFRDALALDEAQTR
jgi:sulfopyruvate decarboxylase subunit beta